MILWRPWNLSRLVFATKLVMILNQKGQNNPQATKGPTKRAGGTGTSSPRCTSPGVRLVPLGFNGLSPVDWSIGWFVDVDAVTVATHPASEGAAEGIGVVGPTVGVTVVGADDNLSSQTRKIMIRDLLWTISTIEAQLKRGENVQGCVRRWHFGGITWRAEVSKPSKGETLRVDVINRI